MFVTRPTAALASLASLVALSSLTGTVAADECSDESFATTATITAARACDLAVAAHPDVNNEDALLATLDTVRTIYTAYAYSDYAVDSGPPYNVKVDMPTMLSDMEAKVKAAKGAGGVAPKTLVRGFNDQLTAAFVSLHDAHTLYIKPACFGWQLIIPVLFSSKLATTAGGGAREEQVVIVQGLDETLVKIYQSAFPAFSAADWTDLIGATIVSIDGVAAVDYVNAMDTYISKDPGPRFNYNVPRLGTPNTIITPFPDSDTITLVIASPTTGANVERTLTWAARSRAAGAFNDVASLAQLCNAAQPLHATSGGARVEAATDAADTTTTATATESARLDSAARSVRDALRYASGGSTGKSADASSAGTPAVDPKTGAGTRPVVLGELEKDMAAAVASTTTTTTATTAVTATTTATPATAAVATAGTRPVVLDQLDRDLASAFGNSAGGPVSRVRIRDILDADLRALASSLSTSPQSPATATTTSTATAAVPHAAIEQGSRLLGASDKFDLLYSGGFMSTYGLSWTKTASGDGYGQCVAYVPSFMPAGIDQCGDPSRDEDPEACQTRVLAANLNDIYEGVEAFSKNGCQRIAFDVTSNGGGMICLGYRLMSQIVRAFSNKSDGRYDIKQSQWIGELTQFCTDHNNIGGMGVDAYLDPATGKPFSSFEKFWDGPTLTRGGIEGKYSQRSLLPCSEVATIKPPTIYYPISRIAIISDGTCGSTCELFLQKMQNVGGVRVTGTGGHWDAGTPDAKPVAMDASSFGGGNVLSSADVLPLVAELVNRGLSAASMPKPFVTSAMMTFDFREMYSFRHPDTVLEWGFYPAANRLAVWNPYTPVDPTAFSPAWRAFSDDPLSYVATDNSCEEGTAVPCTLAGGGSGEWQVCDGATMRSPAVRCTKTAPPPPADRANDGTGGSGDKPADGGKDDAKSKSTQVVLGVMMGVFALASVVLAVLLVRSRGRAAQGSAPLISGVPDYAPPRV